VTVIATVNLRGGDWDLLPHLLRHVHTLGVSTVVVTVNIFHTPDHESIEHCAPDGLNLVIGRYSLPDGGNTDDDRMEDQQRDRVLRCLDITPRAWLMPLDLDEFHEYPATLAVILERADEMGIDVIKGRLIDRFAADGTLARLRPTPSVFEQYPIETEFTRNVLGGYTEKVMLCRRYVRLGTGHHGAHAAHGVPVGFCDDYRVHHFKWRAGLVERIRDTIERGFGSEAFIREAQKFLTMSDSIAF
jgi:hypothetical protein